MTFSPALCVVGGIDHAGPRRAAATNPGSAATIGIGLPVERADAPDREQEVLFLPLLDRGRTSPSRRMRRADRVQGILDLRRQAAVAEDALVDAQLQPSIGITRPNPLAAAINCSKAIVKQGIEQSEADIGQIESKRAVAGDDHRTARGAV